MTGISNVISGIFHAPKHVWEFVTNPDSLAGKLFSKPLTKFAAYEKAHGKEQIEKAILAGVVAFKGAYVPGKNGVLNAMGAAVEAFFESEAIDIKLYFTTQDAMAALAGPTSA